jgi:hypothetical protein
LSKTALILEEKDISVKTEKATAVPLHILGLSLNGFKSLVYG